MALELDPVLLAVLVCPDDHHAPLLPGAPGDPDAAALTCSSCGRIFPVRDGIPIMLLDEATLPAQVTGPETAARRPRRRVGVNAMTGADLLFDPVLLAADDRHALLPAAATAGAQVRATAEQVEPSAALPRPRALVVVGARAETSGALIAACATSAAAPILAVPRLPGWIGPLDVVVVLAAASDDPIAARAADTAQRRGATVVVRGAATGPVAAAAPAGLIVPGDRRPEALAEAGRCTVVAAVAAAAGLLAPPDWSAAADLLDAIALACHPQAEAFVNPALALAAAHVGRRARCWSAPTRWPTRSPGTPSRCLPRSPACRPVGSPRPPRWPIRSRCAGRPPPGTCSPTRTTPRGSSRCWSPRPIWPPGEFDLPVGRALRQALPGAFAVSTDDLGSDAQRSMAEPGTPTPADRTGPAGLRARPGQPVRLRRHLPRPAPGLAAALRRAGRARRGEGSARTGVRAAVVDPAPSRDLGRRLALADLPVTRLGGGRPVRPVGRRQPRMTPDPGWDLSLGGRHGQERLCSGVDGEPDPAVCLGFADRDRRAARHPRRRRPIRRPSCGSAPTPAIRRRWSAPTATPSGSTPSSLPTRSACSAKPCTTSSVRGCRSCSRCWPPPNRSRCRRIRPPSRPSVASTPRTAPASR